MMKINSDFTHTLSAYNNQFEHTPRVLSWLFFYAHYVSTTQPFLPKLSYNKGIEVYKLSLF